MQSTVKLDARLSCCASLVRQGAKLADVGTDHGYLPAALLQSGKIPFAIASDVNEAPLESARVNAERYGTVEKMHFLLTDGLHGISAEDADDIVIAGMGGELILRIVSEADWLRNRDKHLILQPMTMAPALRTGLLQLGFDILEEHAVDDGKKLYSVLLAVYTGSVQEEVPPLFAQMGRIEPHSLHSAAYAKRVGRDLENRIRGIGHSGGDAGPLRSLWQEIQSLYLEGEPDDRP